MATDTIGCYINTIGARLIKDTSIGRIDAIFLFCTNFILLTAPLSMNFMNTMRKI